MRFRTAFHLQTGTTFILLFCAALPFSALVLICVVARQNGTPLRIGSVELAGFDASLLAVLSGAFAILESALLLFMSAKLANGLARAFCGLLILSVLGTLHSSLCAIGVLQPQGFNRNWSDVVRALLIACYSGWMARVHFRIGGLADANKIGAGDQ